VNEVVDRLNDFVWSSALIYLCLAVGLYFSIRTRFMQVRGAGEMIRLMFAGKSSDAGISSFQALSVSLSGRVGTGNIAGVATAIHFGGPGAVFWMWLVAFLGGGDGVHRVDARPEVMASVAYGSIRSAKLAWALGDLGVGVMAWLNIIAILILQKPALIALRDYERQRKAGVEPTFDPHALGIRNADQWSGRPRG